MAAITIGVFSGTSRYYQLEVWESSYSVANNTSVVSWKLSAVGDSTFYDYYLYASAGGHVLYNESGSWSKSAFPAAAGSTSGSFTVAHDAEGKASISFYMEGYARVYSAQSASGTLTLTTIPRASTISTNVSKMGKAGNIYISRAASSFTHTITYSFGNASGTITTKTSSTTVSWTPATTLAAQVPNGTYGTCTLTCYTYSGSTHIGTKTTTFTLYISDSTVPSLTSITAAQSGDATAIGWGVYVQGKSKATVTFNGAAAGYGSTIQSYKVVCDSYNDTTSPFETDFLTSGTRTIYGYVYDKRGRSVYKTTTVTVQPYALPYLTNVNAKRSTQGGTPDDEGSYLTFSAKENFSSCAGHNSVTLAYQLLNSSGGLVEQGTFTSETALTIGGSLAINQSYKLKLTITDALGESQDYEQKIETAAVAMNIKPGGTAVAFGKYSTEDNTFDVSEEWKIGSSLKKTLLNTFFPVGFIIPTADSRNPSTYLGGTWVAIQNRTIVGVGTHALDWTDGSETHAHTMNQHRHTAGSLHANETDTGGYYFDYQQKDYASISGSWRANVRHSGNGNSNTTDPHTYGTVVSGYTDYTISTSQNASTLQPSIAKYLWQRTA